MLNKELLKMGPKRIICTIIFGALLLNVRADNRPNFHRLMKTLKNKSNDSNNQIEMYNNTKIKANAPKSFTKIIKKFKLTGRTLKNPTDDQILSDIQKSSNNSVLKYSLKSGMDHIKHPLNGFVKRFKQKRNKFTPLNSLCKLQAGLQFGKKNYIVFKEKLHKVFYDKYFSPKLSVLRLMYAVVERFWTVPLAQKRAPLSKDSPIALKFPSKLLTKSQ